MKTPQQILDQFYLRGKITDAHAEEILADIAEMQKEAYNEGIGDCVEAIPKKKEWHFTNIIENPRETLEMHQHGGYNQCLSDTLKNLQKLIK